MPTWAVSNKPSRWCLVIHDTSLASGTYKGIVDDCSLDLQALQKTKRYVSVEQP